MTLKTELRDDTGEIDFGMEAETKEITEDDFDRRDVSINSGCKLDVTPDVTSEVTLGVTKDVTVLTGLAVTVDIIVLSTTVESSSLEVKGLVDDETIDLLDSEAKLVIGRLGEG